MLTWGLFAEIVGRAQNIFLENANLLKKLSFPRLCLPVVVVANAGINFAIIFGLFTVFLLVSGNFPGWPFLAISLCWPSCPFAIGLGITLGVLNVFFRDVGQFFGIFLQFWFWLTPIVYPVSILAGQPARSSGLESHGPLMAAFQDILVPAKWPQWESLWPRCRAWHRCCASGLRLFRRHAGEMVDEL